MDPYGRGTLPLTDYFTKICKTIGKNNDNILS